MCLYTHIFIRIYSLLSVILTQKKAVKRISLIQPDLYLLYGFKVATLVFSYLPNILAIKSPASQLFVLPHLLADIKEIIKALYYWSFVWGFDRPSVDSAHKGPMMLKASSCRGYIPSEYRQTSNISRTLVGNKLVDHSDVVGASHVFILDLTYDFNGLDKDNCKTRRETFNSCDLVRLILEILRQ